MSEQKLGPVREGFVRLVVRAPRGHEDILSIPISELPPFVDAIHGAALRCPKGSRAEWLLAGLLGMLEEAAKGAPEPND